MESITSKLVLSCVFVFVYFYSLDFQIFDADIEPVIGQERDFDLRNISGGGRSNIGFSNNWRTALIYSAIVMASVFYHLFISGSGLIPDVLGFIGEVLLIGPALIRPSIISIGRRYYPKTTMGRIRLFLARKIEYAIGDKIISTQNLLVCVALLWLSRLLFHWPAPLTSYIPNVRWLPETFDEERLSIISDGCWLYIAYAIVLKAWVALNATKSFIPRGAFYLVTRVGAALLLPTFLASYSAFVGPYGNRLALPMLISILTQA